LGANVDPEVELIRRWWVDGEDLAKVAADLGISYVVACRLVDESRPESHRPKRTLQERMAVAVKLHLEGVSNGQIRAQVGIGDKYIKRALAEAGIVREPTNTVRRTMTPEQMLTLAKQGLSLAQIAERAGVNRHRVDQLVRKERANADILRRYRGGEPLDAIAKTCGVGTNRIYAVVKAAGEPWLERARAPEGLRELRRRHEAGETVKALADELNVTPHTMSRILRDAGATIRANSAKSKLTTAEMVSLWNSGKTMQEIGALAGISHQSVGRRLRGRVNTGRKPRRESPP